MYCKLLYMESIFLSGYSSSEMNLQYADFCFHSEPYEFTGTQPACLHRRMREWKFIWREAIHEQKESPKGDFANGLALNGI